MVLSSLRGAVIQMFPPSSTQLLYSVLFLAWCCSVAMSCFFIAVFVYMLKAIFRFFHRLFVLDSEQSVQSIFRLLIKMTLRASGDSVLSPSPSTGVVEKVVLDDAAFGITAFHDLVGLVSFCSPLFKLTTMFPPSSTHVLYGALFAAWCRYVQMFPPSSTQLLYSVLFLAWCCSVAMSCFFITVFVYMLKAI